MTAAFSINSEGQSKKIKHTYTHIFLRGKTHFIKQVINVSGES